MKTATTAPRPVEQSFRQFRDLLRPLVKERVESPEDDLISVLLRSEDNEGAPTENEIIDNSLLLFADGIENVAASIGNGLIALLQNPDQLELLITEPERIALAADECLRYDSPAQFFVRKAEKDVEVGGRRIVPGDVVILVVGSANRDERVFDRADELHIARDSRSHLSFGRGRHMCLGTAFAKKELEVGLQALISRMVPGSCPLDRVDWQISIGHRWPCQLKLAIQS